MAAYTGELLLGISNLAIEALIDIYRLFNDKEESKDIFEISDG